MSDCEKSQRRYPAVAESDGQPICTWPQTGKACRKVALVGAMTGGDDRKRWVALLANRIGQRCLRFSPEASQATPRAY